MAIRVQVCGRLVVRWHGRRIEQHLPARQGRLLLVHLVVHRGRPVERDGLVEALWGPDAGPAVGQTLRTLLSRLRGVLGPEALPAGGVPRIVLPKDAFVDLEAAREALHRAEAAVARNDWAGGWAPARVALHTADRGFLPGEEGPWIEAVRGELGDMRLRALECVAAIALGMGAAELPAAERSARRLVALAPFRESGHRLLMRTFAAQGNFAEAVLAYERLRALLRDELGLAPGPQAQDLHRWLLAVDASPPPGGAGGG